LFGIYRWGWGFSTAQDFNGDIALIACFASSWTPTMVRRWHADPFGFLRPWHEVPALVGKQHTENHHYRRERPMPVLDPRLAEGAHSVTDGLPPVMAVHPLANARSSSQRLASVAWPSAGGGTTGCGFPPDWNALYSPTARITAKLATKR
jgi:hypothetical protein